MWAHGQVVVTMERAGWGQAKDRSTHVATVIGDRNILDEELESSTAAQPWHQNQSVGREHGHSAEDKCDHDDAHQSPVYPLQHSRKLIVLVFQNVSSRKFREPKRPTKRCFIPHLDRAYIKTFPPSLPQEHILCLPSHSGHGRREVVEETDLSAPRRLRNPVAGRGHHATPGGRGFGRSSEAAKCPLTDPVKSP